MESLALYAVVVLLAVVVVVAVWLQGRAGARHAAEMGALQSDLRAMCNAAVAMGERVNGMERRLRQLMQRQNELGQRQEQMEREEPEGQSYDQAVKLAQKGASVDDLVHVCGLTRGEAEMVAMMHRLAQR